MSVDTIECCPECGSTNIRPLVEPQLARTGPREFYRWRCRPCGKRIIEPATRELKKASSIRGDSLAAQLERMDPDQVGGQA